MAENPLTLWIGRTGPAAALSALMSLIAGCTVGLWMPEYGAVVSTAIGTGALVAFAGLVRRQLRVMISVGLGQTEAVNGLYQCVKPRLPFPPFGGARISADAALVLVHEVMRKRPCLVCEFGSGVSTIILGYALERLSAADGKPRSLISFEHEPEYLRMTEQSIREHALTHVARVVLAPLRECSGVNEAVGPSYDPEAFLCIPPRSAGLLFVDGPPSNHPASSTRLASVLAFKDRLAEDAVLLFDDANRDVAQIEQVRSRLGPCTVHREPAEKGLVLIEMQALKQPETRGVHDRLSNDRCPGGH